MSESEMKYPPELGEPDPEAVRHEVTEIFAPKVPMNWDVIGTLEEAAEAGVYYVRRYADSAAYRSPRSRSSYGREGEE